MPTIILKSWKPGLLKISLTKLLQEQAGLSLTASKQSVDRLLAGETISIDVATDAQAVQLAEAMTRVGAVCEIEERDQP